MNDLKHLSELLVYRGDLFAGTLCRTDKGCKLEFDPQFIENPIYATLTYRIKKTKEPYIHHGLNLPAFFAGLLPEGLRFNALVKELKTSEDDLFSLLAASGERSIGDVYTLATGINRPDVLIPQVDQIDFYEFFDTKLKEGLHTQGDESIAGVQEKISASMISFPVHTAQKHKSYILKLNPKDKPNLIQNEHQCLLLAKKCGLDVNRAKIVYDKNKNPGLLVERFDRFLSEDKKICKIHQEDACQFLDRYPADKYRLSFQEICLGVRELATAPMIEILKLIQLYIFSYLIGNGDLHAKNISLQTEFKSGRIGLTPVYDLICTYLYKDQKMALKLDGRDANFQRRYFIDFGIRFGLQQKALEQMIDKLISKIEKFQGTLLEISGLNPKEKSLLKNMLETRINSLRQ